MQQRQLRLGDIVDDYCPRERRVTNHAIVAMVEQDVKQTRCTTCDTEHEYKQAKVPPQRKKKAAPGALYQEVLAGMPRKPSASGSEPSGESLSAKDAETAAPTATAETIEPELAAAASEPVDDVEGPVHRPFDPCHAASAGGPGSHPAGAGIHDSAAAGEARAISSGRRRDPRPTRPCGIRRQRRWLRVRRTAKRRVSRRPARTRQSRAPGARRSAGSATASAPWRQEAFEIALARHRSVPRRVAVLGHETARQRAPRT